MRRLMLLIAMVAVLVTSVLSRTAFADDIDDLCGDDPNCTVEPGFGDEGFDDSGFGIPAGFVVLMVLVAIVALGVFLYRISVARDMAQKSGMDPDEATKMVLLEEDGLSATYLASHLRQPRPDTAPASTPASPPPSFPTPSPRRSTQERLQELDRLRGQGLVTDAEYAERRSAILADL